jgi:hydroxymethylglutaryl-CoA lyase
VEQALEANVKEICVFTSASEAFTQKNINCSVEESFVRFEPIMQLAKQHGVRVRGGLSCVMGCPYEGDVPVEKTAAVAKRLLDIGCYEVTLGDTIGIGNPGMRVFALVLLKFFRRQNARARSRGRAANSNLCYRIALP